MKDVFISYSRKDTPVADRICRALDSAGISYFIDRQGIGGGREFPELLAQAIVDCRLFLLIASENSYNSRFTNSEIFFAFNKKPKNSMLPYLIDKAPMPLALEFSFSAINWRTIETHPIETVLVDDILTLLGRERPKSEPEKPVKEASAQVVKEKPRQTAGEDLFNHYQSAWEKYKSAQNLYDRDLAESELVRLADVGQRNAQYRLGIINLGVTPYPALNPEKGFEYLTKAAEGGHREAAYWLGYAYYKGMDIGGKNIRDFAKAAEWLSKAPEDDKAAVNNIMAEIYFRGGFGVERDYSCALSYIIEKPYCESEHNQYLMAEIYATGGSGVSRDRARAKEILRGHLKLNRENKVRTRSERLVIKLLLEDCEYDEAIRIYRRIEYCNEDNVGTFITMARFFYLEAPTSYLDAKAAQEALELAIKHDPTGEAYYLLGRMYEDGALKPALFSKAKKMALKYFEKAAEAGYAPARTKC